jgi:hypothetical protein
MCWSFDHLNLGFVSDFDIRISDFVYEKDRGSNYC